MNKNKTFSVFLSINGFPCTFIFLVFVGLIWSEIKQLWDTGAKAYISDMWNVADFVTNSLYLATIALRLRAYYDVSQLPLLTK